MTWIAKCDPSALDAASITRYDEEVHDGMPKLLGAMATVASLNLNIYNELQLLCQKLYELDSKVAEQLRDTRTREYPYRELERSWAEVVKLERVLPQQVAHFMATAETSPRR